MKNKRFRLISLVLVLVLALQFALVASAVSSASYDFDGGFVIVEKDDEYAHLYNHHIPGTRKHHTSGSITTYPAGSYTVTHTCSMEGSDYSSELRMAASMLGINFEFSTVCYTDEQTIWAYEETGYYYLATHLHGYSGRYDVFVEFGGIEELWDSGFYDMAAFTCDGITGYVMVS